MLRTVIVKFAANVPRFHVLALCVLAVLQSSARADNTVSVMTFNLRIASAGDGGNSWENANQSPERRDLVVQSINNHSPDLVGLQEGEDIQIDFLDANLPVHYAFERQKPSGGSSTEGAAFAYNTNVLQLVDRGVFSLGTSPGGGYWNNTPGTNFLPWSMFPENNNPFPRLALWGRFVWRSTDQEFLFHTTHFDVFNGGNNGESQVRSAHLITDDILARNNRMPLSPLAVVVGDFNGSQNDRAWQLFTGSYWHNGITGDFTDSWQAKHGSFANAGTYHGFSGGTISENARIDWVLYRGGFTTIDAQLVTDSATSTNLTDWTTHTLYLSDHYPALAQLQLPSPASDYDRDGLPDSMELAGSLSLAADPDTDDDGLLDGEEDVDGDGIVEPGESNPATGGDTQLATDIRNHQMDGIRDHRALLLASNGLELYWRFDGRYLYTATQDAGEGSDHFIFVTTDPTDAVSAPFAKSGQVARWDAFLADENDNDFSAWFDNSSTTITNVFSARAATYYENGGWMDGVIDLAQIYGAGFTSRFYLAAAPYQTSDGGALFSGAQVPAGNGDGDILGSSEYIEILPGDADGDGISDYADPDRDGDGLPNEWEESHGLDPDDSANDNGAGGDVDGDNFSNSRELQACTSPTNASSSLRILSAELDGTNCLISWEAIHDKTYLVVRVQTNSLSNGADWFVISTNTGSAFPLSTNSLQTPCGASTAFFRIRIP